MKETLMKLNICLFLIKDDELSEKYNKIWKKKSAITSKKDLIVN